MSDDPLIGYREIGELAGLSAQVIRNYRHRGYLPEPADLSVPDRPRWRRSDIDHWVKTRPGRGKGGGRPPKADGEDAAT